MIFALWGGFQIPTLTYNFQFRVKLMAGVKAGDVFAQMEGSEVSVVCMEISGEISPN